MNDYLSEVQTRVTTLLERILSSQSNIPSPLIDAMQYSCFAPGKRLRPALCYAAGEMFAAPRDRLDNAAMSVEFIHTYSLVHDDLPAMDDDALRRGQATCHKQFDEATAILVGDALQSLAFELISKSTGDANFPISRQLEMVHTLAKAAGGNGMVAGQTIDMLEKNQPDLALIEQMHQLKTGALLAAALEMGGLCSARATSADIAQLRHFGQAIGLAFQIVDDILDVEASTQQLGKPAQSDIEQDKVTFVALLGLEEAKRQADYWLKQALAALEPFGARAQQLHALANFIIARNH